MPEFKIDPQRLENLDFVKTRENAAAREAHERYRSFVEKRRQAAAAANEFRARIQQRYGAATPHEVDAAKLEEVEKQEAEARRREAGATADYEAQSERHQAAGSLHAECVRWLESHGYAGAAD